MRCLCIGGATFYTAYSLVFLCPLMVAAMGIFSPPSTPYVPPIASIPQPPPTPTPVDKVAEDAAARTRAQLAAQAGYGSTNPTGGQGVTAPPSTAFKTLLGQ